MIRLIRSGAWVEGLVILSITAAVIGLGWLAFVVADWLERRSVEPAEPRQRVRVGRGYVVRVAADSVFVLGRAPLLLKPLALGVTLLGVVTTGGPLLASSLVAKDPDLRQSSRVLGFLSQAAGKWEYFVPTATLVPLGVYCFFLSQRTVALSLESRGSLRYALDRWPLPRKTWEVDPKTFGALVVDEDGSVTLVDKDDGEPRPVLRVAPQPQLEDDIALASLFLGVLGAKDEPRELGPDEDALAN